ncbi:helix-turn-helix transcriptional regulator [Proteus sp. TJ1640]|uniref:helix-turn-helix domain-containing protein n=1 Tax=Proteus sp. TJ1640 TaxID=2050968 RepID=UPI000D69F22E|nr:helix-turn-helix transcriptional regulator [Proteus sp. TJ1640]
MRKHCNEPLRKIIGKYIKKARINKSLSGEQLGLLLNVSQQQISRYENAETSVNIETLYVILQTLDKNWEDFYYHVIREYENKKM